MLYDFNIIIYYSISLLTSFCCRSNRISIKWWWCIAYLLYYNMQWALVYWLWTCLSRSNRNFPDGMILISCAVAILHIKNIPPPSKYTTMKKTNSALSIRLTFYEIDREMTFCDGNNPHTSELYVCQKKQNLKRNINFLKIKLT